MNGSSVTISANLESALRYIRLLDKPRVLWIDALCINQRDDTEKGHQVQKMCKVFSSATTVLAWLGPPHSKGERGMSDMRQIGEKLAPVFRREEDGNGILTNHGKTWDDISNISPGRIGFQVEEIDWDAVWDLCDRSFWRRMWIIQELALSGDLFDDRFTSRCLVGCGSEWVPLPVLSTFISVFGLMRSNPRRMNGSTTRPFDRLKMDGAPAIEAMITVIWRFDSRFDHDREDRTLDNIMRLSRSFQVTDPHNKLYGLLGIITDHPIDVDYKLNVSQVYKSLVTSWIESKGNLHCILGNRAPLDDFGPSWFPQHSNQLLDGLPFRNLMRAAQGKGQYAHSPSISFTHDSNIMKARGVLLGKINYVVGPFWSSTNSQSEMDLVGKLNTDTDMNNMFRVLGSLYLSLPENVRDDVWRACVLDSDMSDPSNIISPAPDRFRQLWHALILKEEIGESFEPQQEEKDRWKRYIEPLARTIGRAGCCDRCFFVTEDFRMGVGPVSMRAGEEAVVLFGSLLCFVLQSDEQGYRLVGDAYVQGVDPFHFPAKEDGKDLPFQDFMIH